MSPEPSSLLEKQLDDSFHLYVCMLLYFCKSVRSYLHATDANKKVGLQERAAISYKIRYLESGRIFLKILSHFKYNVPTRVQRL